ncbi:DUF4395 domain-containing protein [Dietzia sp.]|uniref:DUF4395 domain-containing protein n=1 Tax=Dietzia sp. TaxID=1871616 RepID=UPI002FD968C7
MTNFVNLDEAKTAAAADEKGALGRLFAFPNPVNDYAARCTAALVVLLAVATIASPQPAATWLAAILAAGFVLRVAGGPRYSPFGRLSVHVLAPRVSREPKLVAGPPKRFAQTIGLVFSGVALVLFLVDASVAARIVLGLLVVAALLESALGFCLGCWMFAKLQKTGIVPESVCVECANIWNRPSEKAQA